MTRPWHVPGMRRAIAGALVLALAGWEPFRALDPDVEAGNRAYAEGRYDDALAAYDRAAERGGVDPAGLAFDRGTAALTKAEATKDPEEKRRWTERGLADLGQAARATDPRIRADASYNRGNALMGQGKLDDAIAAYKQALREQPSFEDARLNLELALRRRQNQPQRQQGQGQGQGQQGQGQGQGQQGRGQGQQGQGQQGQGQQGQGQQGHGQQGQGQQGQQNPEGQPGGSSSQGGHPQDSSRGQPGTPQRGSDGQGSSSPDGQGAGSGQGRPPGGQPPRGRTPPGRGPAPPRTPADRKLDDLDDFSRRLQREDARRRATGRATDPQHDW